MDWHAVALWVDANCPVVDFCVIGLQVGSLNCVLDSFPFDSWSTLACPFCVGLVGVSFSVSGRFSLLILSFSSDDSGSFVCCCFFSVFIIVGYTLQYIVPWDDYCNLALYKQNWIELIWIDLNSCNEILTKWAGLCQHLPFDFRSVFHFSSVFRLETTELNEVKSVAGEKNVEYQARVKETVETYTVNEGTLFSHVNI